MTGYLSVSAGESRTTLTSERPMATKKTRDMEAQAPAVSSLQSETTPERRDDLVAPTSALDDLATLREHLKSIADAAPSKANLSINRDEESGRFVYRFLDPKDGSVIKQYPAEDVLDRLAAFRELTGKVVDDTA